MEKVFQKRWLTFQNLEISLALNQTRSMLSVMNSTNQNKATKQTVKILGYTVTVGTKKHALLVAQVKHFNDLAKYENN